MVDYEKVVERVENMIYSISGCNTNEAKIVLDICIRNNRLKKIKEDEK